MCISPEQLQRELDRQLERKIGSRRGFDGGNGNNPTPAQIQRALNGEDATWDEQQRGIETKVSEAIDAVITQTEFENRRVIESAICKNGKLSQRKMENFIRSFKYYSEKYGLDILKLYLDEYCITEKSGKISEKELEEKLSQAGF